MTTLVNRDHMTGLYKAANDPVIKRNMLYICACYDFTKNVCTLVFQLVSPKELGHLLVLS